MLNNELLQRATHWMGNYLQNVAPGMNLNMPSGMPLAQMTYPGMVPPPGVAPMGITPQASQPATPTGPKAPATGGGAGGGQTAVPAPPRPQDMVAMGQIASVPEYVAKFLIDLNRKVMDIPEGGVPRETPSSPGGPPSQGYTIADGGQPEVVTAPGAYFPFENGEVIPMDQVPGNSPIPMYSRAEGGPVGPEPIDWGGQYQIPIFKGERGARWGNPSSFMMQTPKVPEVDWGGQYQIPTLEGERWGNEWMPRRRSLISRAEGGPVSPYDEYINEASRIYGVEPERIRGTIAAESSGRPEVVSPKGAVGLMQLMPTTAQETAAGTEWEGRPAQSYITDPRANIHLGTKYLSNLYNRFNDWEKAHMAYNWGPTKLQAALQRGAAIPSQVMNYARGIVAPGQARAPYGATRTYTGTPAPTFLDMLGPRAASAEEIPATYIPPPGTGWGDIAGEYMNQPSVAGPNQPKQAEPYVNQLQRMITPKLFPKRQPTLTEPKESAPGRFWERPGWVRPQGDFPPTALSNELPAGEEWLTRPTIAPPMLPTALPAPTETPWDVGSFGGLPGVAPPPTEPYLPRRAEATPPSQVENDAYNRSLAVYDNWIRGLERRGYKPSTWSPKTVKSLAISEGVWPGEPPQSAMPNTGFYHVAGGNVYPTTREEVNRFQASLPAPPTDWSAEMIKGAETVGTYGPKGFTMAPEYMERRGIGPYNPHVMAADIAAKGHVKGAEIAAEAMKDRTERVLSPEQRLISEVFKNSHQIDPLTGKAGAFDQELFWNGVESFVNTGMLPREILTNRPKPKAIVYRVEGKGTIEVSPDEVPALLRKYPKAVKVQ